MKKLVFIALVFTMQTALAQSTASPDPYFTQTQITPMFFNPAYAGIQQNLRASFQVRDQNLAGTNYLTTDASIDIGLPKINSGVGLLLMSDQQDNASLITNTIGAYYAYEIQARANSYFRLGLEASLFQRLFVYDNSTFDTSASASQHYYPQNMSTLLIPNFGFGALYYSNKYYLDLSAFNLTMPNASFNNDPNGDLQRRFVLQAGEFVNFGNLVLNPYLQVINQGAITRILPGCNVIGGDF